MRLLRLLAASDIAKRRGSHIVRLTLADERVVLDQELDFRIVRVGLVAEDLFGFSSVIVSSWILTQGGIRGQGGGVLGDVFEFHIGFQSFAGCFGEFWAV